MEMRFQSKGISNYLDINMGDMNMLEDKGLTYQIEMMVCNNIMNLIRPVEIEEDANVLLRYKTNGFYVLERLFYKIKPDGELLKILINQINDCCINVERFLLSMDDLVIDPDYMFYDYGNKKLMLVCVPGYNKSIKTQLKKFFEYLMQIFDHRDREGILELYSLYDDVCDDKMMRVISENYIDIRSIDKIEGRTVNSNLISDNMNNHNMSYGDAYTAGNESITEVQNENVVYRIIPLTNGGLEDIILESDSERIVVGRGKKESDYRIKSTQISRIHAWIYKNNNSIYVEDKESTNGTYVNAVRISPSQPHIVNKGDIIGFANEEFFVS